MQVTGWILSEGRYNLREKEDVDENTRWQGKWRVTMPFASVGVFGLLDQSSRSAQAISGIGRTLSRRTFTKGGTESDFLHYALGELRGHWDEGEMGIWVDGKDGFSERGITCYPREINVFVAGVREKNEEEDRG
jgi:hypothetical protein